MEMLYLKYDTATIDNIISRKKTNDENLVDMILDTVSSYTDVVDKTFIKASIKQESDYTPLAVSSAGARGLIQFMPYVWPAYGEGDFDNAYDPIKNIRAGIKLNLWLEKNISKYNPVWDKLTIEDKRKQILAAYNGGFYRLKDRNWEISKMPKESIKHAEIITKYISNFQLEQEVLAAYNYVNQETLYAKNNSSSKQNYN